jgi:hypothetical protein
LLITFHCGRFEVFLELARLPLAPDLIVDPAFRNDQRDQTETNDKERHHHSPVVGGFGVGSFGHETGKRLVTKPFSNKSAQIDQRHAAVMTRECKSRAGA